VVTREPVTGDTGYTQASSTVPFGGRLRTQKMMKEETGEIPLTVLLSSLEHLVVLVHRPQASLKMAFNDG
jgi:hypothetical protein